MQTFKDVLPKEIKYIANETGNTIDDNWLNIDTIRLYLPTEHLVLLVKILNLMYRLGTPVISDEQYDHIFLAELKDRCPDHEFFNKIEEEPALGELVKLPEPMLSTQKLYTLEDIHNWLNRIKKAATTLGKDPSKVTIKFTPKLDGWAGYLQNNTEHNLLATRGDGEYGTDISHVLGNGLYTGDAMEGPGEIVVEKLFFKNYLSNLYENTRNFIGSAVKASELSPLLTSAFKLRNIRFMLFSELVYQTWPIDEVLENVAISYQYYLEHCPYNIDGVVLEAVDSEIKIVMGNTRTFHRWQAAYKVTGERFITIIESIKDQTSRTGRVNPVITIIPVRLGGVMVKRATAHNYKWMEEKGVGQNSTVVITRAGEVIPAIIEIITPTKTHIPIHCPSCGAKLIWDNKYLICPNLAECPAQSICAIQHFFKCIGNNEGFGKYILTRFHEAGIDEIDKIYRLDEQVLTQLKLGKRTINNILDELKRSRTSPLLDYKFLSAFGIKGLGRTNCEIILCTYGLDQLFTLSVNDLLGMHHIGSITATCIIRGLAVNRNLIERVLAVGFNIISTKNLERQAVLNMANMHVCFTGTMLYNREEMMAQAKKAGMVTTDKITGKTTHLVVGLNPGKTKVEAAKTLHIPILTDSDFRSQYLSNSL